MIDTDYVPAEVAKNGRSFFLDPSPSPSPSISTNTNGNTIKEIISGLEAGQADTTGTGGSLSPQGIKRKEAEHVQLEEESYASGKKTKPDQEPSLKLDAIDSQHHDHGSLCKRVDTQTKDEHLELQRKTYQGVTAGAYGHQMTVSHQESPLSPIDEMGYSSKQFSDLDENLFRLASLLTTSSPEEMPPNTQLQEVNPTSSDTIQSVTSTTEQCSGQIPVMIENISQHSEEVYHHIQTPTVDQSADEFPGND